MTNRHSLCKCTLKTSSVKSLIINRSPDGFSINHFPVLLGADGQGIRHQVVNQTGIALGKTVYGRERSSINDGRRSTCQPELVQDIL